MFTQGKNLQKHLKDTSASLGIVLTDNHIPVSYTKTNKLITALYMVTDIIDKDEPLRSKLRTLGLEILSDIEYERVHACRKIAEVMSFLDIASAINIISAMNTSILRKEFLALDQSIKESIEKVQSIPKDLDLSEFFKKEFPPLLDKEGAGGGNYKITTSSFGHSSSTRKRENSKGHTRIGVQKGSTLMQALSDKTFNLLKDNETLRTDNLEIKNKRRARITSLIQLIGGNATIKDIKDKIKTMPEQDNLLSSLGEKTLQRELGSMVKDDVLDKTGEKRWSRYFLNSFSS